MCKIISFFEGGMTYTELSNMPIDEFIAIIDCAKEIDSKRKQDLKRGQ